MSQIENNQYINVDLSSLIKNIRDRFSNMVKDINAAKDVIAQGLSSFSKTLVDVTNILREGFERFGDVAQEFSLIMFEAGWPPLPEFDLYPSEMVDIVKKYIHDPASIKTNIEKFVIAKFGDKELDLILSQWEKRDWLKKRLPILREVIQSHIEGKYFVAVAGLLPQVEGIIADGYRHSGKLRKKKYRDYVEKLLNKNDKLSFDDAAKNFLFEIVLINFEHGNKLGSSLSRHAILHGADVNYGSKANSLKCILLFDYLQNKFGVVSIGHRKTYHLFGCRIIKNKTSERKVYESRQDAENEGKKPCKVCKPSSLPF
jgi:hypothetical protein